MAAAPGSRGQVITSVPVSEKLRGYDFVSRVFQAGVEDAVTGSAHCGLGPLWNQKMEGKKDFKAFQASKRGGEIDIEILDHHRILLSGYAVQTAKGILHV